MSRSTYRSSAYASFPVGKVVVALCLFSACLLVMCVCPPALASEKKSIQYVERSWEEEIILSVRLREYILSDAIIAYKHQTGVLLPLGEIMSALDFAVDVDTRAGIASGWFLRENREFYLDAVKGELTLLGRKISYQKELVELHEEDIFVDASLFSKWFPIDIEVALPLSRVKVTSREPLPLEERLEREKRQGRLGSAGSAKEIELPFLNVPYGLISIPQVDVNLRGNYRKTDTARTWDTTHNLYLAGDLLYMTGNMFIAGDRHDKLSSARLTLERKFRGEEEVTPLHISEVQVGDVFTPSIPLMLGSQSGRGVSVSNFPLEAVREFDRITLRGDLPIGWEVELYRNDSLLDAKVTPDDDGRYEFTDVALLFGSNTIKLQFYGPQGQRREEIKTYNVGADSTPPGKNLFSLSVNQQDKDLFESINESGSSSATRDPDDGKGRAVFEYERGINTRISALASLASVPFNGKRETFASVGGRFSAFGTFSKVKVLSLLGGGNAYEVSTQFEFKGINVNASHQHFFSGYESESISNSSNSLKSVNELSFNGVFAPPLSIIPRLSYGFDLELEEYKSGESTLNYGNRLSGSIQSISFTNNLDGKVMLDSSSNTDDTLSGDFLVNTSDLFGFDTLSLRGGFGYDVKPSSDITNASFTADYDLNEDMGLRFGVNKQFTGSQLTSYSAGLNKDYDAFSLSTDANYDDQGDFTVTMNMNFSLDFNNGSYVPGMSREKSAGNGSVLSQVFLDNNGNRVFDDGDEPIEEAKLKIGSRASEEMSNQDGVVHVRSLSSYRALNVSLDKGSLPDPYWAPMVSGNSIVPRPGKTAQINFPVSVTGEIDGVVYMESGESDPKEISNVIIELLDQNGSVVATEKTAYDGFYLFLNIFPGNYKVCIAPSQLKKFGINMSDTIGAIIESDGTVLNGLDFYLPDMEYIQKAE